MHTSFVMIFCFASSNSKLIDLLNQMIPDICHTGISNYRSYKPSLTTIKKHRIIKKLQEDFVTNSNKKMDQKEVNVVRKYLKILDKL